MGRALLGAFFVAVLAVAIGWRWYGQERVARERQAAQIAELNAQAGKIATDNERLKSELAKVQDEENKLARENDALHKALETAKLTGKVPDTLPYPPK